MRGKGNFSSPFADYRTMHADINRYEGAVNMTIFHLPSSFRQCHWIKIRIYNQLVHSLYSPSLQVQVTQLAVGRLNLAGVDLWMVSKDVLPPGLFIQFFKSYQNGFLIHCN